MVAQAGEQSKLQTARELQVCQNAHRNIRARCPNDLLGDPGYQMLRQATQGPVDFITGDYLAEVNLAENGNDDS